MATSYGTQGATGLQLGEELHGAVGGGDVPEVDGALAERSAGHDGLVLVELEEDDAGGARGVLDEREVVGRGVELCGGMSVGSRFGGWKTGRTLKSLVVLLFSSTAYSKLGSLNSSQLAEVPAMVLLATMANPVPSKSAAPTMPVIPPPIRTFFTSLACRASCLRVAAPSAAVRNVQSGSSLMVLCDNVYIYIYVQGRTKRRTRITTEDLQIHTTMTDYTTSVLCYGVWGNEEEGGRRDAHYITAARSGKVQARDALQGAVQDASRCLAWPPSGRIVSVGNEAWR